MKKVLARTLRYLAHSNGAFLMYLGGLQAGAGSSGAEGGSSPADVAVEKTLLDNFSRLMNHLIFTGLEKRP